MRYRIAFVLVTIALLFMVLAPSSTLGQGKGKKGGFGQGSFGPDGFNPDGGFGGPGGFGGFGGKGGKGGGKKKGGFGAGGFPGADGFSGQGGFGNQGGFQGGFQASFGGPGRGNPLDSMNQMVEADFNMRDRNGDGFLNQDEMPPQLRAELSKWDTNRDNLISLDEYKFFYATNMQNRGGRGGQFDSGATIVIEEEDLDTRPDVWRAGKLPKELPAWFKELDTDKDGQVALYEWRRGGKDIDEFADWDRNNDGYITPEEALSKQRLIMLASAKEAGESGGPMMKKGPKFNMSTGGEGFTGKKNRDGFGGGKKKGDGFAKLKSVE